MAKEHREPGSGRPVTTAPKKVKGRSSLTRQIVGVLGHRRQKGALIIETGGLGGASTSFRTEHGVILKQAAERVEAVMRGAANEGLTLAKDGRITGRISSELIATAKARTGLQSDTELLEFALANVALKDDFAQVFRDVKGTVDPDIDLGL